MKKRRFDPNEPRRHRRPDPAVQRPHGPIPPPDWPALARALVREARRYDLTVPHWLAAYAGYREPPTSLRVLPGGAAPREDSTRHARRSRFEDRTADGGATIIVGSNNMIAKWKAHLDAQATKTAPTDSSEDTPE